jgi:hypothetical protein
MSLRVKFIDSIDKIVEVLLNFNPLQVRDYQSGGRLPFPSLLPRLDSINKLYLAWSLKEFEYRLGVYGV